MAGKEVFFSDGVFYNSHGWQWPALDQRDSAFSLQAEDEGSVQNMAGKFDVCVTGSALAALLREEQRLGSELMHTLVEKTRVFARVTPDQKEFVVRVLNDRYWNRCDSLHILCALTLNWQRSRDYDVW